MTTETITAGDLFERTYDLTITKQPHEKLATPAGSAIDSGHMRYGRASMLMLPAARWLLMTGKPSKETRDYSADIVAVRCEGDIENTLKGFEAERAIHTFLCADEAGTLFTTTRSAFGVELDRMLNSGFDAHIVSRAEYDRAVVLAGRDNFGRYPVKQQTLYLAEGAEFLARGLTGILVRAS